MLSRVAAPEEVQFERQLRPAHVRGVRRPGAAVASLRVSVEAARQRGGVRGPRAALRAARDSARRRSPASSPTRWATHLVTTSGPALERGADLMGILTNLGERRRAVHRRDPSAAPRRRGAAVPGHGGLLGQLRHGQGPARADASSIALRPFTLVGATTRAGHAVVAAARALRHLPSPGLLLGRRARRDRHAARRRSSDVDDRPRRRAPRSRGARAGRRASPTGCCAACATTRR